MEHEISPFSRTKEGWFLFVFQKTRQDYDEIVHSHNQEIKEIFSEHAKQNGSGDLAGELKPTGDEYRALRLAEQSDMRRNAIFKKLGGLTIEVKPAHEDEAPEVFEQLSGPVENQPIVIRGTLERAEPILGHFDIKDGESIYRVYPFGSETSDEAVETIKNNPYRPMEIKIDLNIISN